MTTDIEQALRDAIGCVEAWGAYAPPYFQKKHDLEGDIARLRAILAAHEARRERGSFEPLNKETATTTDKVAWALCQIIDDDAPMRWTRYRFAAGCIALNKELMADLGALAAHEAQLTDEHISYLWAWSATSEAEKTATTQQHAFARAIEAAVRGTK